MPERSSTSIGDASTGVWPVILWTLPVALIYFLVAHFSLLLTFRPEGIAAVWPPSGIFLSSILLVRRRIRPYLVVALFLSDLAAELLAGIPPQLSLTYSAALAGEAVLGAWLLLRFVGGPISFRRTREVTGLLFLSIPIGCALSATVAQLGANFFMGSPFWPSWLWWWTSDAIGSLLTAPLIISSASAIQGRFAGFKMGRTAEGIALLALILIVNGYDFSHFPGGPQFILLADLIMYPLLIWASFRFGVVGTATASLLLAAILIEDLINGTSFISETAGELTTVIVVQAYVGVAAVSGLFLATAVTERRDAEGRVLRLNRTLTAVRDVNQLIAREQNPHRLLEDACSILVRDCDPRMVWVGLIEPGHQRVVPVAHAGLGTEYLDQRTITWDDSETGKGPTGTAIRTGTACSFPDLSMDPLFAWRRAAQASGFASCLAVPLSHGERKFGALSIYSSRKDAFDPQEVELFQELADDLAYSLEYLEGEAERRQVEQQLRYQATMLELANDAIVAFDADYKLTTWNRAAESMYGWKAEEVLDKNGAEVLRTEWLGGETAGIRRVLAEVGRWRGEITQQRKDGTRFPVETSSLAIRDENDRITGYVSVNRDITERKRAEQEIQSLSRFPMENPYPVLRISPEGVVLYANGASRAILEAWGARVSECMSDDWRARIARFYESGMTQEFEVVHEDRIFSCTFAPIPDSGYLNVYGLDITERRHGEAEIQRHIDRLTALSEIDRAISSSFDLNFTLFKVLAYVPTGLGVDAADILVLKAPANILEHAVRIGFRTAALQHTHLRLGESFAGTAALERRIVQASNLRTRPTGFLRSPDFKSEDFDSYVGVPLMAKGKVLGVLEVFRRGPLEPDPEWLTYLNTLAEQAAIAIDNARLFEQLESSNARLTMAYEATLEGWSRALDLRDRDMEGHTERVAATCVRLARQFDFSQGELENLRRGALLHDIGKMGVPDSILLKRGPLTDAEWTIMKKHPTIAYELLSPIEYLRAAVDIPYCHHEKWDGTGYPRGLKGKQIPVSARIFAVVDVLDALTSDRPYRKAWMQQKALDYIQSQSGSHFDPEVVARFFAEFGKEQLGSG